MSGSGKRWGRMGGAGAMACAAALAAALAGCDRQEPGKPAAPRSAIKAPQKAPLTAQASLSERVSAVPGAPEGATIAAIAAVVAVVPPPPPPPPLVAPPRQQPEPLQSAPIGGLRVEQMLADLEKERSGLLSLKGPGAMAEIELPRRAVKKGSRGEDARTLCAALSTRGFMTGCESAEGVSSESLDEAIRAAQASYGLVVDGIADKQLYNALRMTAPERAERVGALIEQWREVGKRASEMGASRYIVVNIPSFEAKAVNDGEVEMVSPVIVGRPGRQTPIGVMSLVSLKFNPNWTPPPGILKKDVFPRLAQGGDWIERHGLVLLNKEGDEVPWRGLSVSEIRSNGYRFVQPAGEDNALGVLKFETDSKENIYLHDTNERGLFSNAMRAKSSGCVRVKEWRDLAAWAAAEKTSGIDEKVGKGKTAYQKIDKIPVFVIYQLADYQKGKSVVYPDIYNKLEKAGEPEARGSQKVSAGGRDGAGAEAKRQQSQRG